VTIQGSYSRPFSHTWKRYSSSPAFSQDRFSPLYT